MFHQGIQPGNLFIAEFYGDFFKGLFYLFGMFCNLYILHKCFYIYKRQEADFNFSSKINFFNFEL